MKELMLQIDDDVVDRLKSFMGIKKMTGSLCGVEDDFVMLILGAVEKKEKSLYIVKREVEHQKGKVPKK